MKEKQLKQVVEKIHIKSEMEEEIMKNVKNAEQENRNSDIKRRKSWKSGVVAAVATVAIMGVGGLTAYALVNSPVRERMENMSEKETNEIVEKVDSQQAEAATYSREFTEEEKARKKDLTMAYQQGQFPESEIKEVEDECQVEDDVLCYMPSTAYYYLPERDLTDEEILQLIDQSEKINYSLEKRYEEENTEEVLAKKKEEERINQENQENGGISEGEAIKQAEEWMNKIYSISSEGMKLNHYVESAEESIATSLDGSPVYFISYAIEGSDYYNFGISGNGELLYINHSGGGLLDAEEMSLTDAEGKIETLYESAQAYLTDTFGISEEFAEVYCSYSKNVAGDGIDLNIMNFWFVKEDRMAYRVTFSCESSDLIMYDIKNYDKAVETAAAGSTTERIEVKLK